MTGSQDLPTRPALVRLDASAAAGFDRAVRLIESAGGRVRHAYPPAALIADLPEHVEETLVGSEGILSIDRDAVAKERAAGDAVLAEVISAWNAHLLATRTPGRATRGLPWDAPGRLPPDPPAEVREQLRRRERGMRGEPGAEPEDDEPRE